MRVLRKIVSRKRDGTFRLNLDTDEQAILAALVDQVDPLLDDPTADPALRRLFPPARTDDLLAEAQWEIEKGANLRDAHRASLEAVRTSDSGPLTEEGLMAWVQGINALRLVLAERLEVDGDEQAEDTMFGLALARAGDDTLSDDERDAARRIVMMWQVYEHLGVMVTHAVRALD